MPWWMIAVAAVLAVATALNVTLAIQVRALAREIRLYYLAKRAILTRGINDD